MPPTWPWLGLCHAALVDGVVPKMPMMALGTGNTGCSPNCSSAVTQALQLGFRHIDTAYDYHTQVDVAKGLREAAGVARDDVWITTKIPGPIGAERADALFHQGLQELNMSFVDLLLMHYPCDASWPDPQDACSGTESADARLETWRAMERIQQRGLARHVGVSNYHVRHLERLLEPGNNVSAPFVNQVEWHLGWHDEALLEYCKQHGIQLQAYSPLGGGGTTTGHNGGIALDDPTVQRVARAHNASSPQVALRWSLDKGVALVTSTVKASHMKSDLEVFNFTLSAAEVAALSALKTEVPSVQIVDDWPDVTMPVVAMSTQLSNATGPAVDVREATLSWLQLGGRHIDVARAPGSGEAVGAALKDGFAAGLLARDELFVTARLPGPIGHAAAVQLVNATLLPALGLKQVDLLLMGSPCQAPGPSDGCGAADGADERADTWRALEALQAAGAARSVGVANFRQEHLEALLPHVRNTSGSTSAVAVNQVEWHLGWHDEALLDFCRKHGIQLQAHSPLGGAGASHPAVPLSSELLRAVARQHNISVEQAVLRWSIERGVPVSTVAATREAMAQSLSPLFSFQLSSAELATLDGLGKAAGHPAGAEVLLV